MGLRLRTALARRRVRRRSMGRRTYWPVVLLFVLLIVLPSAMLAHLRPKLSEYAANYVQYQATTIMEQAVAQCATEMGGMSVLQTDEDGAVTSLTTDTAAINQLRTQIVQQVYDDIGALETARASVAVGTLIDPQYLAGLGPVLSFGVTALGSVTAQVESNFSIQSLGRAQTVTVSAEYPLEETIIVGDVPLVSADS